MKKLRFAGLLVVVLILAGTLLGCKSGQSLVGSWQVTSNVDSFQILKADASESGNASGSYTCGIQFNSDGTAAVLMDINGLLGHTDASWNWSTSGDNFSVTEKGNTVTLIGSGNKLEGTYAISGKTLTLTLASGTVVTFKKTD